MKKTVKRATSTYYQNALYLCTERHRKTYKSYLGGRWFKIAVPVCGFPQTWKQTYSFWPHYRGFQWQSEYHLHQYCFVKLKRSQSVGFEQQARNATGRPPSSLLLLPLKNNTFCGVSHFPSYSSVTMFSTFELKFRGVLSTGMINRIRITIYL